MPDKTYTINEIFYSLQGEGARAGTANVFVRFSGCNLTCTREKDGFDCDTEFTSGTKMTKPEILELAAMMMPRGRRAVIFTGGEPLLQLDDDLVQAFEDQGWYTAIETNGTVDASHLRVDWLSVSPKGATHTIKVKKADELRYVRAKGQAIPHPACEAPFLFLSPAFEGDHMSRENVDWCILLIKQHPEWRLSVQQHKLWGAR